MKQFKLVAIMAAVAFIGFSSFTSDPEGAEIRYFQGTFKEAQALSAKEHKPIMIDAYTVWCGWCKHLDATTFSDAKVVKYLNENYIVMKMDMERGEGIEIRSLYDVNSYPDLLFINSQGNLINRIHGFVEVDPFMVEARKAKTAFAAK